MIEIWKRLTAIEGTTAQQLAASTGLPIREVRAELNKLQAECRVARWKAPVGQSDLWWRWEQRPLSDHTIIVALALALDLGKPDRALREIMLLAAKRGWLPGLRHHMTQCAKHPRPRYMAAEAIRYYRECNGLTAKDSITSAA